MTIDTLVSEQLNLATRECVPCRGGVPPLTEEKYKPLLAQLKAWSVIDGHHLEKTFEFKDFVEGLAFVNQVGEVAEKNGHHPDIYLAWGKVRITVWTHKINGLTDSDFILAAKCDALRP
jgi:4a-hydroxytetrahydrobiopterin dehydratase